VGAHHHDGVAVDDQTVVSVALPTMQCDLD
jgi:hypothetical protein